jgi:hypothetical protein
MQRSLLEKLIVSYSKYVEDALMRSQERLLAQY